MQLSFSQILQEVLHLDTLVFMNVGLFVGIVFGAIPGLTGQLGIILVLPLTFGMDPTTAMLMLLGIYCGGAYGGSISAILIGTPGTNEAAATLLDGHPLARKGYPKKALVMAVTASTIGGLVSAITLLVAAPPIARFTLRFGPAEYFSLAVFGLSIIAGISGDNILKGLVMCCIGILLSEVGIDPIAGGLRFTFGSTQLYAGLGLLPVLLGAFAIPEILRKIRSRDDTVNPDAVALSDSTEKDRLTAKEILKSTPTIARSSIIGVIIGAIPAAGAAIAAFISYNEAKRSSKKPETFGHGNIDGVAAAETANNAVTAASLIPLLTLGIPGSVVAATLVGGFMLHGLVPGPGLFREQALIVYAIMVGLVLVQLFMYAQGRLLSKLFALATRISDIMLVPILVVFCVTGAFAFSENMLNITILLAVGFLMYILSNIGFSPVPLILGIILGPIAEMNLRRALTQSGGDWSIFVTRPLSVFFLALTVVLLLVFRRQQRSLKKSAPAAGRKDAEL